jgi:hypothetical protein
MTNFIITSVLYLTPDEFENRGTGKGWKLDTAYESEMEKGKTSYFFSPDGVGRVWFDTLDELLAETNCQDKVVVRRND